MKTKVKNFAMNNWDSLAELAIIAIAEVVAIKLYKKYLDKVLDE